MWPVQVASVVGAWCVWHAYVHLPLDTMDLLTRRRALAGAIRTAGAMLWPAVLLGLVPKCDRGRVILALPLAWVTGAWLLDAHLTHRCKPRKTPGTSAAPASLRLEPTSITALTFGLCSLVGARPESRHTHLFLYAIVGCIAIVLPSHTMDDECLEAQVFESVQKVAMQWCVGLVVAGVGLARSQAFSG